MHECAENLPCSKVNGPEWTMHARSRKKWMARKGKCQSVEEAHVQPWIKCHSFGVEQSYQMVREGMKKNLGCLIYRAIFQLPPTPSSVSKLKKNCHMGPTRAAIQRNLSSKRASGWLVGLFLFCYFVNLRVCGCQKIKLSIFVFHQH